MIDVVERAKAALKGYRAADHSEPVNGANIAGDVLAEVMPELVAEVERLRAVINDVTAQR